MKTVLSELMVHFDTEASSVALPITAIQAVEACDNASSYVYLKEEYRYNNIRFVFVREACDEIVNTINQAVIDANKQIMEEA